MPHKRVSQRTERREMQDVAACHMPQIEMAWPTYLPTENKAWGNSPCLLGAGNGPVLLGNVRWRWAAAGEL